MLIKKRKFDIRCWVLLTHNFQVLICKEGYGRTSSSIYDLEDKNILTHLTNNAIQCYHNSYSLY